LGDWGGEAELCLAREAWVPEMGRLLSEPRCWRMVSGDAIAGGVPEPALESVAAGLVVAGAAWAWTVVGEAVFTVKT
jgi:hypothetical protein